ncbi:MAG TPA: hypothetical protein VEF04_17925, partial [Blastocatellia bacterium]|nr:hypothetical protein [Blastocatellia bacterium]
MALAIKKQSFGRRISDWIARFAAPKGMELPESGRSSVEDNLGGRLSSGLSHFGGLQPEIDFTYLELLRQL